MTDNLMSVMAAFESFDFLFDLAMRFVKYVIEMEPDNNDKMTGDMPDLLKDIYKSKMTRCEDQLSDHQNSNVAVHGVPDNGQSSNSTTEDLSPVPFSENDETDILTLTSEHISVLNTYITSTTGSRDLESLQKVALNASYDLRDRRVTYPEIFDGPPRLGNGWSIQNCEVSLLDQRRLNISMKKPCPDFDLVTNQHEEEEVSQLTNDIVVGLRNIGDSLDRKINPKVKKDMWEKMSSFFVSELKNSFLVDSIKTASKLSVQVMAEYNRL